MSFNKLQMDAVETGIVRPKVANLFSYNCIKYTNEFLIEL